MPSDHNAPDPDPDRNADAGADSDSQMLQCVECGQFFAAREDVDELLPLSGESGGAAPAAAVTSSNGSSSIATVTDGTAQANAAASREDLRLCEKGTDKVHIYEGWAWHEDAPENKFDWLPSTVTEANVSKQGINHLEEL